MGNAEVIQLSKLEVVTTIIANLIATYAATLAWFQSRMNKVAIQEVHITMNSRLDALLKATAVMERAAGRVEGIAAQKAEQMK